MTVLFAVILRFGAVLRIDSISHVLGGNCGTINLSNADMNSDGDHNISDVTTLISRVLKYN